MQLWYDAMNCVGSLQVSVVEGKKLVPKELDGTLDAYVVLELENEQVTTLASKNSLNPDWLADFQLGVCSEDSYLMVFVYEARTLLGRPLIGKASVSLREFVDIGTNVQWVVIKSVDGVYAGEVCLVLRYTRLPQIGTTVDHHGQTRQNKSATPKKSANLKEMNHSTSKQQTGLASDNIPMPIHSPQLFAPSLVPHSTRQNVGRSILGSTKVEVARPPSPPPVAKNKLLLIAGAAAAVIVAAVAIRNRKHRRGHSKVSRGDILTGYQDLQLDEHFNRSYDIVKSDPAASSHQSDSLSLLSILNQWFDDSST